MSKANSLQLNAESREIVRFNAVQPAIADFYSAVPPDIADALGIEHRWLSDTLLTMNKWSDSHLFNNLFGVNAQTTTAVIDEAVAAFEERGIKHGSIQVPVGVTHLEDYLSARGFLAQPQRNVVLMRDTAPAKAIDTNLSVREINHPDAWQFAEIISQAAGFPADVAKWAAMIVGRPGWQTYGAFEGEKMVSGGSVFIHRDHAWFGFGATLEAYRGRGAQRAIIAARIGAVRAAGVKSMTVEVHVSSDAEPGPSYRNLRKAGFEVAYERRYFSKNQR